jgi:hypothetical protein
LLLLLLLPLPLLEARDDDEDVLSTPRPTLPFSIPSTRDRTLPVPSDELNHSRNNSSTLIFALGKALVRDRADNDRASGPSSRSKFILFLPYNRPQ